MITVATIRDRLLEAEPAERSSSRASIGVETMNKIDLGQALTILANIGVIAGIIFLGLELRQNRDLARAQMQNDLTSATQEIYRSDINGPIADILARNRSGDPLTEADRMRLNIWQSMWLAHTSNMFFQFQQGLYPKLTLDSQLLFAVRNIPSISDMVCRPGNVDPDFTSYIQTLTGESCQ